MTTLEQARALWQRGLSVFPVPRPRPGATAGEPGDGKVPAIAWREFQTRRPTERELERLFRGTWNIAIVTGAVSDLVVVDADTPPAVRVATTRLTYTAWQTQTARGFHLFYRHPGVRVANRARIETPTDGRLAIDVRGDGGYVIGPGSVHASGAVYTEAGDWTVSRDDLPRFWPGWLQRAPRAELTPRPPIQRPTGDVVERARRYLAAIPRPEIGHGSDPATLYAACRLVRGFELAPAEATTLLWEWAGGREGWTYEWIAAKVAHALRYGTEPIGALR